MEEKNVPDMDTDCWCIGLEPSAGEAEAFETEPWRWSFIRELRLVSISTPSEPPSCVDLPFLVGLGGAPHPGAKFLGKPATE